MTTPIRSTLLDVVQTVCTCATSDDEVVATVAYLINSSKVLLCGTFAGAKIDLSVSPAAPLFLATSPPAATPSAGAAPSEGFVPSLGSQALTARRQNRGRLA